MTRHIHFHFNDQSYGGLVGGFIEAQHPRSHGRFVKKGSGTGATLKKAGLAARGFATSALRELGSTGKEDYEALKNHFKPHSEARKSLGSHVRTIAGALPAFVKAHYKEQKHTIINAGQALRHIATGNKPTSKQTYALARFGTMVAMTGLGMLHGDPTGMVGHAIVGMVQDIAQHTAIEHAADAAAGVGRYAYAKVRGHDAANGDDIEYELLKKFLMHLADNMEKLPVKGPSGAKA